MFKLKSGCLGIVCYAAAVMLLSPSGSAVADEYVSTESAAAVIYEAENSYLKGTVVSSELDGYSGTGYVTSFTEPNDFVEFTVNAEIEGYYPLEIRYAAPFGDKTNIVEVNGLTAGEQFFPQAKQFSDIYFGQVLLDEGENKIKITTYWGYFDIDCIMLGNVQNRPAIKPVQPNLVHPMPSSETKALMSYLAERYGKNILAGQQVSSMEELAHIYAISGKLPAILSYSASNLGDQTIEWAQLGGIVAAEWHWEAPMGGKDFLTANTSFDVSKAVTPGTPEFQALVHDLDEMAQKLKKFQEARIPVIWRPLHEAEGGWFWWGAKGPTATQALYKLMYERFTRYHGLDNLIWVWTTSDSIYSKDWYPGDAYVDIVGVDRYIRAGDYSTLMGVYDKLVKMFEGKKLVAFLENGPIPDPRQLKKDKVGWMYFNTWSGKYILDGKFNSEHHLRYVYNHPYVITLDELPSEQIYGKRPLPVHMP
jgi:mannan endo-1,4-beta-mannosidase